MIRTLFVLLIFAMASGTTASTFTIVPETQYVYLNHNVTFECATNLTGYTLTFSYDGSIAATLKQTNLPNGGIKVSTTFIVINGNNGTSVLCIADDSVNTPMATSVAYAYAQGPPAAVSDLQGYQLDHCCIVFSWSPPFTLGQLSVWYQVTLSVGEEVISSEVIYTTNYTYCPIDLTNGEYRLNITTMNGAGTGIWNSNTTIFKKDPIFSVSYFSQMTYRQNNKWTYYFKIPSTQLCTQPILNTTVMSCNLKNSSYCYNSTNVTIITDSNGYKTIISVIDLPPRKKFNTFVCLQYKSRQIFQTTPVVTSTHDLQQLIPTKTSNDILCLQFVFVNGSTINEVHLFLQTGHTHHLINVKDLSLNDQLTFNKCFNDIPSGYNWTLYACDGALPQGSETCSNPAVILVNVFIGKVSGSSLVIGSTITISKNVMPTTSIINTATTSTPFTNTGPEIGAIIKATLGITAFLGFVVIICSIVILAYLIYLCNRCMVNRKSTMNLQYASYKREGEDERVKIVHNSAKTPPREPDDNHKEGDETPATEDDVSNEETAATGPYCNKILSSQSEKSIQTLPPKSVNLEVKMLENDESDKTSDKEPLLFDSKPGSKYLVTVKKFKE